MSISRFFAHILTVCLLLVPCSGLAQDDPPPAFPPLPTLSDPLDQQMQRLATIYQKDPRFTGLSYNHSHFSMRGCAPASFANMVIAAFDVDNPDVAAQIVEDTLQVLCDGTRYNRGIVDQNKLKHLLNPQQRRESAEKHPGLAMSVGNYTGTIDFSLEKLHAETVQERLNAHVGKAYMTTGRISVNEATRWEALVRILFTLHEAGQDDAVLLLAYAGAGTDSGKAPLRTSANGHYLTLYIHVGTFLESGRIYVLDSMPRALADEEYGPGFAYRRCYGFVEDKPDSAFNTSFTASRINPVIIRTDFSESAQAHLNAVRSEHHSSEEELREALVAAYTDLLSPYIVYGHATALLRLNGNNLL